MLHSIVHQIVLAIILHARVCRTTLPLIKNRNDASGKKYHYMKRTKKRKKDQREPKRLTRTILIWYWSLYCGCRCVHFGRYFRNYKTIENQMKHKRYRLGTYNIQCELIEEKIKKIIQKI